MRKESKETAKKNPRKTEPKEEGDIGLRSKMRRKSGHSTAQAANQKARKHRKESEKVFWVHLLQASKPNKEDMCG